MIAFIDLETTGLDEHTDKIIEFGCVMVNEQDFETVGELNVVINPVVTPESIHPRVLDMHMRNGLWQELAGGLPIDQAEAQIVAFLDKFPAKNNRHILAGSGVSHFDYRFLKVQMPQVTNRLTFWTYDVGVLRRAFEAGGRTDLVGKAPKSNHRALEDARSHAESWRKFMALIKQIPEQ